MLARRIALIGCLLSGCGGGKQDEAGGAAPPGTAPGEPPVIMGCAGTAPAPDPLPGVDPAMAGFDYWAGRAGKVDAVVLAPAELANLAAAHGGGTAPATAPAPLTRRAFLQGALAQAGKPAAGDPVGDLLASLALPAGGSFTVDLAGVSADDRRLLIAAAARAGVVVLHAGEHRMALLGIDAGGAPRVVHALADYGARCVAAGTGETGETRMTVGKVVVSGLELGAGTSGGSLLDQLTRITLYARAAGPALAGAAVDRPAAPLVVPKKNACDDSAESAIFVSPRRPNQQQPLRVIATLDADPGPVAITLVDPAGKQHTPEVVRLGGPPWSLVATVPEPAAGRWMVAVGDGTRVDACVTTQVARSRPQRKTTFDETRVWPGRRNRTRATENLFAAFVERLFDYPVEEDLTWPNLHTLLRDRDHNILHDHLGQGEDDRLVLDPDCADLPYMLHAYFAWKMDLPFAWVTCTRGSPNKPPKCKGPPTAEELAAGPPPPPPPGGWFWGDNLMPRYDFKKKDDVGAFAGFAARVFRGVHSSAGRTAPDDELTDWYPVALTREALRPGTMFADPFGHLLVIAGWYPQKPGSYGMLMGADAQPDATIGRRRFWRGNYLFTSDTRRAGAGFKAYRPRRLEAGKLIAMENKQLARKGAWWTPYSGQQYAGSTDDFYDTMEELINPRPLDAMQMQVSLVDALQEAVVRRVNSVDNGEKFMKQVPPPPPVEMPDGAKIFLTSGPWEDYSTPARDHRILIAIDTVRGLGDAVKRRPERYRVDKGAADQMVERLRKNLDVLLATRKFQYTRSDGQPQTLTLKDVVDRAAAFEMAYNPNDCAEIRWGAPEGSAEMQTCTRRAPEEQRQRMEKYRVWFRNRERPVE